MKRKDGYILVLTLLVVASMLVIGIAYADFYRQDKSLALKGENDHIAAAAADAGIQDGIYQLKKNNGWNAGFSNVALAHAGSSYSMSFDSSQNVIPFSTNNYSGTANVQGFEGRDVPAGAVYLISVGRYANSTRTEHALVSTKSYVFQNAITADNEIKLNGGVTTDSFNSSIAPYSSQHLSSGGNLHTNSADNGAVQLNGTVNVMGNIAVGPGGNASTTINAGGGAIYQSASVASSEVSIPVVTPTLGTTNGDVNSGGMLAPGTYGNLSVSNNLQLQAGTYIFTGDFSLSGKANVLLPPAGNQKVEIYILGNMSITGNTTVNGNTKVPGNLIVYGGPDSEQFKIGGLGNQSQDLYFVIYAPKTEFKIGGNAQLYGSVVAQDFNSVGGTADLHYDSALITTSISGIITVKSTW
jgi:hypothetical protein